MTAFLKSIPQFIPTAHRRLASPAALATPLATTWKLVRLVALATAVLIASGCSGSVSDMVNPYHGGEDVEFGERSNRAILEDGASETGTSDERARHALEVMKSYQRSQDPEPYKPVLQPAVVRLMWIPDHLNKSGDLVPAHYYFLKVKDDQWAVQDAFEIESQLSSGSGEAGGAIPWVYEAKKKGKSRK